ncbi:hypothetical protein QQ054_15380 [Oscillatoria amoena NRMC-F 0135]|nr:hypothetical protein [Geitlerinema splendidum]MDL5047399.1 hypothetical protein [Oscillatoria amoena NRMC-F 0135]
MSSGKQCQLTPSGRAKLETALEKIFGCEPADNKVAEWVTGEGRRMSRITIGDVRKGLNVNSSTLENLFYLVKQGLNEKSQGNRSLAEFAKNFILTDKDYESVSGAKPKRNRKENSTLNESKPLEIALDTLDYKAQNDSFDNYIKKRQIISFLIQGKCNYGQLWLTNRLVRQHFEYAYVAEKLVRIDLPTYSPDREIYIDTVWTLLAKRFSLGYNVSVEACIERAVEYWLQGTLIFCIRNFDALYPEERNQLLDQFWIPLVEKAKKHLSKRIESCLILFLVDSRGVVPLDPFNCMPDDYCTVLPMLTKFGKHPDEILKNWVRTHRNLLNCPEPKPLSPLVEDIWSKSNEGIPEYVFEEICKRYQPNSSWLKIKNGFKL